MLSGAIEKIKQLLADSPEQELPAFELKTDNFHHPYIQFPDAFAWPAVSIDGVGDPAAQEIASILWLRAPHFIQNCQVLPAPRPKKNVYELQFVREYQRDNRRYLYIFKISTHYMGGANENEVLTPVAQGLGPSFQTDRIYYQARLLPVESIQLADNCIVDFEASRLKETMIAMELKPKVENKQGFPKEIRSSTLFDELDFSEINHRLLEMFAFGEKWRLEKIFKPFVVEHLTLCLALLYPQITLLDHIVDSFHIAWSLLLEEGRLDALNVEERAFWNLYYRAFRCENVRSRSGNPHWRFLSYPDMDTLAG